MDKKNLEKMCEPSAMKMARENRARLDSLHLATGVTDNLLKIAKDLDYSKRLTENIAIQDLLSQLSQAFPQNNLAIDNSILGIVNSLAESNPLNPSLFESIKLNIAFMDSLEKNHLGLKPQTQFILPEGFTSEDQIGDLSGVISKATEFFKQYDQFSGLESFKALSKLENFPFQNIKPIRISKFYKIDNSKDKTIFEIDSEISDELALVDDFNELSEERRTILLELYQAYYYPIILNCLVVIVWLQAFLDERLDLTNNTFIFVEKSKEKLSYLGNVCRPKPSGVIEGLIGSAIFTLIMKVFG